MSSEDSNKRPRNYYVDYTNKKFGYNSKNSGRFSGGAKQSRFKSTPDMSFGNRGFLITAFDEFKSYLEMRNIFEEYFESIYKEQIQNTVVAQGEQDKNAPTTVEEELESELKRLRKTKPFKQLKTQCRKSLFLNILDGFEYIDPVKIVDRLFNDLEEKRLLKTSNTFKVLPVLDTFRNSKTCAQKSIENQLSTRYKDETRPIKYFIEFQSRGNYKLDSDEKMDMIKAVAETISQIKPEWTVSRETADYMIILTAFKNVCCLSIVNDYFKRRKYNIAELCKGSGDCQSDKPQEDESSSQVKCSSDEEE